MALMGAKPVPLASSTTALSLSSRRKKVPNGPSSRKISRSFSGGREPTPNTRSVKCPPGRWRMCSSTSSSVPGAVAME